MATEHELRLKIDAAAAQAGAKQFSAAIESVKRAVKDLEKDSTGAFTQLRKIRPEVDVTPLRNAAREAQGLGSALTGAATASDRAAANIQRTALASASAVRMAEQAAQRLTLRMQDLGNTAGIGQLENALAHIKNALLSATTPLDVRVAKSGFDDLRSALLQTTVEAEHLRGAEAQLARELEESNRAAASHADTLNRLRAAHDPLFASSQRYAAALGEIDQLTAANALTETQASAARERAAQTYLALDAAADRASITTGRAAAASTSLMYNLQDVGVMMAAGQNPFMLAMQQGTQIAGALEASGAKGAKAFELLKTAALSVVSPLSLISIGLVFLSATAVQAGERLYAAFSDGEHKIVDTKQALDTLAQSIRSASDAAAGTSFRAMRDEFGATTAEVRALVEAKKELSAVEAQRALESNRDSLAFDVAGVGALDVLRGYANNEKGRVLEIRDALDLTKASATQLENLFRQSEGVSNARELAGVYAHIRQVLLEATGGVNSMNAAQREVYGKLVESEAAARRLAAAQDGAAGATHSASGAASGLAYNIGTAADEAGRLLANLNGVPAALSAMGSSVAGQIASIRAQNRALNLELTQGLSSAAANRQVQLETMISTAGERGQHLSMTQLEAQAKQIAALDAAAKEQKDLQARIQAANKPASGGGRRRGGGGGGGGSRAAGAGEEENALARLKKSVDDRILSLQNENTALQLVATGQAKNVDSAKLMVEAMAANGGQIDATTGAMIRQIDALTKLNEQLKEAARDPVREFMNSLPSWQKTGNDITEGVIGNIQSSLHDLMTGDFTFEGLADALLGTFADAFAPLATGELMKLTGLDKALTKGNDWIAALGANSTLSADGAGVAQGGAQAGQSIAAAMTQAGATVAQQIGAAMTSAGGQAQMALQSGVSAGGLQAASAQRAAGMTHATQVRAATIQGGQQLGQGVVMGSQQGAPILAQGVASGAAMGGTGGGLLSGVGGWSGLLTMALGAFEEGGVSTSPVGFASAPVSAFRHAPHFAQGTTNTSGIPAVLHPNEAVIPLSKGRKIGVELNGDPAGGSTGPTVQNINFQVTTPNPDGFRKSRSQVEADLARAGHRSLHKNG